MGEEKLGKLENILDKIVASSKNLKGCSLITADGFSIVNRFVNGVDEDKVAEMSASIQRASEIFSKKILDEDHRFISINGEKGFLTITKLSSNSMLLILTDKEASLGIISLEQKQNIRELIEIL